MCALRVGIAYICRLSNYLAGAGSFLGKSRIKVRKSRIKVSRRARILGKLVSHLLSAMRRGRLVKYERSLAGKVREKPKSFKAILV
jgi:hypothetical protein